MSGTDHTTSSTLTGADNETIPETQITADVVLAMTAGTNLSVAPLRDALPAEEVSTRSRGRVSPLLQAQDAAGASGAGAPGLLRTAETQCEAFR